MIKKIKNYFYMRKLRKEMQVEVLETLATICLWLNYDGHHSRNPQTRNMLSHFQALKRHSEILKKRNHRSKE